MNCVDCKDFTCPHRSGSTGGRPCYYESGEQKEKLLTMTAEATLHYVDWSSFRREAAKDILVAMTRKVVDDPDQLDSFEPDFYARVAVEWADSLVKHLKMEKEQ